MYINLSSIVLSLSLEDNTMKIKNIKGSLKKNRLNLMNCEQVHILNLICKNEFCKYILTKQNNF